jgi:NADPH2 dehydrogenase
MHAPLAFVIINLSSTGMGMADPIPTFTEVVKRIRVGYPDFAYIHVLERITHQTQPKTDGEGEKGKNSTKLLRDIWGDGAYIANSDFGRDSAIEAVEKEGGLVSFARHFISNVSTRFALSILIDALGR